MRNSWNNKKRAEDADVQNGKFILAIMPLLTWFSKLSNYPEFRETMLISETSERIPT